MPPIAHALPALLLAGPGGVFAALALSYRRDARRAATTGERCGAAAAGAGYGCLAALSCLWAVTTTPLPTLCARPALGVGVAVLVVSAGRLWFANRARGRVSALAVTSVSAPVGGPEGNCSAHAAGGTGRGGRRLAVLHRRQCAVGTRQWHPRGTY